MFQTSFGGVGVLICHDRWYPEAVRTLRKRGAEIVLNPVAAGTFSPYHTYFDIHRCVLRTQAYVNGLYLASCNSANHGGHSLFLAPDGTVVAEASARQEVMVISVNPDDFGSCDFVSNTRPELYT